MNIITSFIVGVFVIYASVASARTIDPVSGTPIYKASEVGVIYNLPGGIYGPGTPQTPQASQGEFGCGQEDIQEKIQRCQSGGDCTDAWYILDRVPSLTTGKCSLTFLGKLWDLIPILKFPSIDDIINAIVQRAIDALVAKVCNMVEDVDNAVNSRLSFVTKSANASVERMNRIARVLGPSNSSPPSTLSTPIQPQRPAPQVPAQQPQAPVQQPQPPSPTAQPAPSLLPNAPPSNGDAPPTNPSNPFGDAGTGGGFTPAIPGGKVF